MMESGFLSLFVSLLLMEADSSFRLAASLDQQVSEAFIVSVGEAGIVLTDSFWQCPCTGWEQPQICGDEMTLIRTE